MYWTDICASVHIHNSHLEVRPNKMQHQIWHANQLSKFNILHSTDLYSITTLNALKTLNFKAPLYLTFLGKLYRNVHLQTHCSLWPSDSKNESVPFDSHDPPVQPPWADYIARMHCVCTQCAWGAFSLCISEHTRVRNERHLDADSESDLHVNHSPPPDCSYWVKCGGNFMHGRSPSIIKQFFLQFRKN